jgi:hypothetical protein
MHIPPMWRLRFRQPCFGREMLVEKQDVQKVRAARPQQAVRRIVLLYVEPRSEARTPLVCFLNILLAGIGVCARPARMRLIPLFLIERLVEVIGGADQCHVGEGLWEIP